MTRLIFCGFMGAGKSKLGRLCATNMALDFYDLDQVIAKKAGKSIPEIFDSEGEAAFRDLEARCLDEMLLTDHRILSLGGGAIRSVEHAEALKVNDVLVWIDPAFELLLERIIGDARRPMVGTDPDHARRTLTDLYDRRMPIYDRAQIRFRPQATWFPQVSANKLTSILKRYANRAI
jgi:shikimate kinase